MAGIAKKRDQDPDVEDGGNDALANDRTLADPRYTRYRRSSLPRVHSGAKVEAPLGSYNFPLASVCPRTTPTAGQPMGVGH